MAEWVWNVASARYHDLATGRFMARSEVLGYVDDSLAASGRVSDTLARFVADGTLSPADWRNAMRQELKEQYITEYLAGRGGVEQMTQADWGSIGGSLAEQYRYLDGFTDDIATGELSEAQIRARAKMYVNSAREAHERGYARAANEAGLTEVKWTLNPAVENCPDCIAFASLGWQPVEDDPYGGCYPGSGCTVCLTNCACSLEYRESEA